MPTALDVEKTIENTPELKAIFEEAVQTYQNFLKQVRDLGCNPTNFDISHLLPEGPELNGVRVPVYVALPLGDTNGRDFQEVVIAGLEDSNFDSYEALYQEINQIRVSMQNYTQLLPPGINDGPN